MAACKFNAPNGKKSVLYDKLSTRFDSTTAIKTWAWVKSPEFKKWYGNGKVDTNGEPIITNNFEFVSEKGEIVGINGFAKTDYSVTLEEFTTQIENLSNIFTKAGLDIKVELDSDMLDIGSVITINDKTKIKFNPRKAKRDTVFHEFGHIYIDMLGYEHPLIQRGIELLKGSDLWNKIARLYKTTDEIKLGKEVLTTAVGIESARIFNVRTRVRNMVGKGLLANIKGWKYWIEYFFETLGNMLGIGQTPVKKLAYDLASFNLHYKLTHKPANYKQKQKAQMTIDELRGLSKQVSLTKDEKYYIINNDENRKLGRVTTVIEELKGEFDRDAVIKREVDKLLRQNIIMTEEEIATLWADKREEGTVIHAIAEDYINTRNSGEDRATARKYVLDNVRQTQGGVDEQGIRIYGGGSKELVEGYVDNIIEFIESLYAQGYKLYPEVKIFDEEMGVSGTIDLLIEKPNGNLMIYDWKTKEIGKFDDFYTNKADYAHEALTGIKKNKANDYALQLSTYALMLRRKGFTVDDMAIIGLQGDIITDDSGENRYANLHLFSSDVTKQNKDGVLPLNDLSEELEDVYIEKEDIEEIVDEAESTEKTVEELLEDVSKLTDLSEHINNLILNLKRSISRMKATANVTDAIRFENIVKDVIKKLMVEDEMQAIAAYAKFIANGLTTLYARFQDNMLAETDENGNTIYKLRKGYDGWDWAKIKEVEANNPKEYMEFLSFLINADMFVEQAVYIREIPMTDAKQHNFVLNTLKKTEGMISDIKLKIKRLNQELDHRYIELSSNPLYGGRGVLENAHEFFKAQMDESFMQANFDAMADTHNSYMANIIRLYDYRMRRMEDEVKKELETWEDELKLLIASGSNIDKFIDKSTGKLYTKTNYTGYFAARGEMFRSVLGKPKSVIRTAMNKFFNENVEPLTAEEKAALDQRKLDELGEEGFKEWQKKQTYVHKKGKKKGKRSDSKTGAYYKPKAEIWGGEQYKNFNAAELRFYNYLTNTLHYLVDHVKESVVKNGYLPAVPLNQKGFFEQLSNNIGWRDKGQYSAELGVIENEQGEIVQFLPFMYNNLLNQEKFHSIDSTASEEVKNELRAKNQEIAKANKAAHAAAVNMNLAETMPAFIRSTLKHKHKKAIEFELLRAKKSFIDNHKIKLQKGGKDVVSKQRKAAGLENTNVERSTVGSNALKHYENWLRMVFYEEFEVDEGTWQKVARVLQNFTSFKGMALNPLSAMNNQIFGTITSMIESGASQHFSTGDWAKATKDYNLNITSYFADAWDTVDDTHYASKTSAFFHHFNIMQDLTEQAINDNTNPSAGNRALRAAGWITSKAYAMEHLTEHNLQNRVLLAMAYSHKIVNGQVTSFEEYKRGKLKPVNYKMSKEESTAALAYNKQVEKTLREAWDKETTVFDAFDFIDGRLKPKDGFFVKPDEMGEFQRKVMGVNQYLHGIYNKEDAGTIQQYALGRLAIQFRKWMRSGWTKRWGTRFGKTFWNERRNMYDEGAYITTMRFFGTPFIDAWTEYKDKKGTDEQISALKALGNIVRDYGKMFTNLKVHWHTLNDTQKANVIRTLLEYFTFASLVGILYLLKDIKGDDEEPNAALLLALYQTDRTITELTTFVPLAATPGYVGGGWLNETKKILKSPTATFNTIESGIKMSQYILMYPFTDDEGLTFQSGVYAGENRLMVEIRKNIPLYNQFYRIQNLANNYKHYKLF